MSASNSLAGPLKCLSAHLLEGSLKRVSKDVSLRKKEKRCLLCWPTLTLRGCFHGTKTCYSRARLSGSLQAKIFKARSRLKQKKGFTLGFPGSFFLPFPLKEIFLKHLLIWFWFNYKLIKINKVLFKVSANLFVCIWMMSLTHQNKLQYVGISLTVFKKKKSCFYNANGQRRHL